MHRYPAADGIRGLACLLVLCTHLPGFFLPDYGKYVTGTGKYGVWLFFVLSAFLLTSRFKATGFGPGALWRYAVGRVAHPSFIRPDAMHLPCGWRACANP